MHVVLPTVGSAGDVLPMVEVGTALLARGHQVTVMVSDYFRSTVEEAGLEMVPLGTAAHFERTMENPDLWHPQRALRTVTREGIAPAMRPTYEYLAGLDPRDTVVAASSLTFGARLAQERLGFPLVTVDLQPTLFLSAYDNADLGGVKAPDWLPVAVQAWRLRVVERRFVDPVVTPPLNAYRAELGLPPVSRALGRWLHSPVRVLGLFPSWFAAPRPDWPQNLVLAGFVSHRPAGAVLEPEVEDFLVRGDAPVVVTAGSAMRHGERLYSAAIDAAQALGRRAILLTRFHDQLPTRLPAGMLHADWAPLGLLLSRAAALVHHGGIGTAAQALAAGVPQLVVPYAHDQPDNADRLVRLGVAARLDPAKVTGTRVAAALDGLLGDARVRGRCAGLAARVDFDAAARTACEVIESASA
ncbi:glycosyltransferase [Georgenia sp. SYP-B2076]|uniref:glycosyltransferase n=1 Tax=Georgenia sp. SYP-B2076 TaxID=2495881 RepID=UPI000F8D9CAB|nr:glycosyltransferase [Georgenia sp. SYP-B2076]